MDIARVLAELKLQRKALEKAIAALEAIAPWARNQNPVASRRSGSAIKSRRQSRAPGSSAGRSGTRPAPLAGRVIPFRVTPKRVRTKPSKAEEA